jgi:hypothetical protein
MKRQGGGVFYDGGGGFEGRENCEVEGKRERRSRMRRGLPFGSYRTPAVPSAQLLRARGRNVIDSKGCHDLPRFLQAHFHLPGSSIHKLPLII